jgi:hypothetical protein
MTNDITYIRPSDVCSPKRLWSLVQVLFDGGEDRPGNPSNNSLAIGLWGGKPVLAMRWNGNKENPLGNPQSRGLPTWFIVPEQHWKQILETEQYRFSDDKIAFARSFLESRRVYFFSHCPKAECRDYQKLVLQEYRTNELADILEKLKRGDLKFWHIICDGWWEPSPQEKVDLTAVLKTAGENLRLRSEVKLSARLRTDGTVEYAKNGIVFVGDKPLRREHLRGQLTANGAPSAQIDAFEKQLAESGSAEMWIPRPTSVFFTVQGPV